jgi:hypothetical protein
MSIPAERDGHRLQAVLGEGMRKTTAELRTERYDLVGFDG